MSASTGSATGITAAQGFRAAGVAAGLKSSGAPDVAVVVNDGPSSTAAAVFTGNRCKANPVIWSQEAIKGGSARAVAINSGGANCYTGPDGFAITHATAELVAELLEIGPIEVQICSTGLIGMLNDKDGYTIGGMAKGAGMLAPALATMLVVITTDAVLEPNQADAALRAATGTTFDRLDSDGCQSTNDTVLLMASGASGVGPEPDGFAEALRTVCHDLAMQLLADAEGADHEITIDVVNAATEHDAVDVGRSIARSNLFKCAIFGKDPNWGRVLASVGTTDAAFDPADLDVALNDVWVCRNSGPGEPPESVSLENRAVSVTVDLKAGDARASVWTNDLTHAYVHENSAYST
jgi:glutamate N-acetyltransferase/amino-acid N-acetyltransferase